MSEPYLGEIRCFGFMFAPLGWMKCAGQSLAIANYEALYAVIGTTYGGDGQVNFNLPNLQGRVPMHWGTNAGSTTQIGQTFGVPTVTLTNAQMPQHTHTINGADPGDASELTPSPKQGASYLSRTKLPQRPWRKPASNVTLAFSPKALQPQGSSMPHDNMQPYLVLNFSIATEGIFPSRN
jgi:microcystin-dependent protein